MAKFWTDRTRAVVRQHLATLPVDELLEKVNAEAAAEYRESCPNGRKGPPQTTEAAMLTQAYKLGMITAKEMTIWTGHILHGGPGLPENCHGQAKVWTPQTDEIVRQWWGIDDAPAIARRVNQKLDEIYAERKVLGRHVKHTGRSGIGVVHRAAQLELIDPKDVERLSSQAAYVERAIPKPTKFQVKCRDGRCCLCGSTYLLAIDHIVAFSDGGSNELENLWRLCRSCNQRKRHHSWPPSFAAWVRELGGGRALFTELQPRQPTAFTFRADPSRAIVVMHTSEMDWDAPEEPDVRPAIVFFPATLNPSEGTFQYRTDRQYLMLWQHELVNE